MAKRLMKPITCPHCKAETEMEVWDSVNVSLNATLKQSILNGTFFDWTCPECGQTARIFYPFLYIDMLNRFMIWTGTPKSLDHDLYNKMTLDGYKFRYVRVLPELVEKIILLENEIDDYALETMKFTMMQALYKQGMPEKEGDPRKGPVPVSMQFRTVENNELVFLALFKDAKPAVIKVAPDSYLALKAQLEKSPFMQKFLNDTAGKFQLVDASWGRNATIIINTEKMGAQIKATKAAQEEKAAESTEEKSSEE
jgi:hypothetical protein